MADQAFDPSKPFTLLQGGKSETAPDAPKGHDFKLLGVNIHVPPEEQPRPDSNVLGWGENGAGVAPEDVLMGGQAVRKVAGAAAAGGTMAGVGQAVAEASPILKYEITRSALTGLGLPAPLAAAAAAFVAGRKGKVAEPEHVSQPGFPRTSVAADPLPVAAAPINLSRVPAGSLTQEQIAERLAATKAGAVPEAAAVTAKPPAGTRLAEQRAAFEARVAARQAPAAAEVPSDAPIASPTAASPAGAAPAGKFSTQKALNELALAARRAKTTISPQEADQLIQAVEGGQTAKEAVASLLQERLAKLPGMMSDAEVQAALDAKHAAGAIKSPSAATAAARRKGARP